MKTKIVIMHSKCSGSRAGRALHLSTSRATRFSPGGVNLPFSKTSFKGMRLCNLGIVKSPYSFSHFSSSPWVAHLPQKVFVRRVAIHSSVTALLEKNQPLLLLRLPYCQGCRQLTYPGFGWLFALPRTSNTSASSSSYEYSYEAEDLAPWTFGAFA